MKELSEINLPDAEDLKVEAIKTLFDKLGLDKTAALMQGYFLRKSDYVKLKQELFKEATVESLAHAIKSKT